MGYNYERVNFGKYLENVRISHDVSIDELSKGVCNRSLITRIESGERVSTMLLRDRLIERCGATSDEYEKYVKVDEFEKWKQRTAIIADIETKKYDEAKIKLGAYAEGLDKGKKDGDRDSLEEQFYLDVKAMIAGIEGKADVAILAEQALRKTVEIDCDGFVSSPRLAPKEINLAIEYSRGMERTKRCEQLSRLLQYAEEIKPDKRNMVLFYPKLVYELISENLHEYKEDPAWLAHALELSDRASALLFETNRLIYILELSEVKKQLWEYILALPGCIQSVEYERFLEEKNNNDKEYALWTELGRTFGVDMHTRDWCYIHYENGVKCIGDVIKRRRETVGKSLDDLCEGIYSTDTLKKCEKLLGDPQPKKMMRIFERLGLQKEYQNTFVTVANSEIKQSEDRIMKLSNMMAYDDALAELRKLDEGLIAKTPENRQFIMILEAMIRMRKKEMSPENCYAELYKALQLTLPVYCEVEEYYLTRMELNCVYNMAMVKKGNVSGIIEKLIMDICDHWQKKNVISDTMVMELFLIARGKIYLAHNDVENAEKCSDSLIKMELIKKRNAAIYPALNERILVYNKMKNNDRESAEGKIATNDYFIKLISEYRQTYKTANKQTYGFISEINNGAV